MLLLLSGRGALAAAGTEPVDQPGTYEPVVIGLAPAVYIKFEEIGGSSLADSSGNGRPGALKGTGAALGAAALAPNVGSTNSALNLGSAAWVEIPHSPSDVALTFPSSAPWTGGRKIADCTVSIYFKPKSLPVGGAKHVIVSKSSAATPGTAASYDGSWEAYIDADGAVHVEARSFRGRPARIRTPDGALEAETTYHLVVQLSYDGVAAWLDGAKFEDGYADALHVFGLSADILGEVHENDFDWMIGKAAWGGQADLIVDEFAIYLSTLDQSNAEALAQVGATAPLKHSIWGQATATPAADATAIQAAIDSLSGSGGGTVDLPTATLSSFDMVLKSNVRVRKLSGTFACRTIRTPDLSLTSLSGGDTLANGSRVLAISNSVSPGDLVAVQGIPASPGQIAALRYDRDYNSAGQSPDPHIPEGQLFEVEDADSSSITFVGRGWGFPSIAAGARRVHVVTPTANVAIEGDIRATSSFTSSQVASIQMRFASHYRLIRCTGQNTADQGQMFMGKPYSYGGQIRECTIIGLDSTSTSNNLDGLAFGAASHCVSKDCLATGGRHGCDFSFGGNGNNAILANYCEHHGIEWDNNASGGGKASAFGAHGPNRNCIIWNGVSNWGGPNFCGIRQDQRWHVCGNTAGEISCNDGGFQSYVRDIRIVSASNWFRRSGGVVSVDQCHFENITRASGSGGGEDHNLEYGTGADVNTYTNVTEPSGSWQLV